MIEFYIDCSKFSDEGKNLGRLYGNKYLFKNKKDYLNAMRISTADATFIKTLLKGALTDRINDREIFMKGIDYSYYYEQED